MYVLDAVCFVYTCRRLIDLSLIAGTRPPRLSFPGSAAYAFKHKYPQCLDYVFFCNGSVGSIKRTRRSTQIEKFTAEFKPKKDSDALNLVGRAFVILGD